jgi:hypothetical protein
MEMGVEIAVMDVLKNSRIAFLEVSSLFGSEIFSSAWGVGT